MDSSSALGEGGRRILLQTAIIRVPRRVGAGRRERIRTAVRVRRALAAARVDRLQMLVWGAALLWMTEPLQTFLSGVDPTLPAAAQAATPFYRYARYVAGLAAFGFLLQRVESLGRLARAAWPLLLLFGYAAASLAWSQDRLASQAALLAGAPSLVAALALGVAFRPARVLQALLLALAGAVFGSLLAVLLLPHFAVAGASDVLGASAPGDWRGLYGHKNALGHVAGLAAGLLASRPGRLLAPPSLRWAALAAAVACLIGAHSVAGAALGVALPVLDRLLRPKGLKRVALAAAALVIAALAFAARARLLELGLTAMRRDATLSGRTAIWSAAADLTRRRALLGWGLDYSVSPTVAARLTALFGVNHVHNAGLDVFINLGSVGLALAAAAVVAALLHARRRGVAGRGLALLAVGWIVSGLTEDMGVRTEGPIAELGLCAMVGLYAYGAARRSFRRPVFGFDPAWRAPLRPPRLRGPP